MTTRSWGQQWKFVLLTLSQYRILQQWSCVVLSKLAHALPITLQHLPEICPVDRRLLLIVLVTSRSPCVLFSLSCRVDCGVDKCRLQAATHTFVRVSHVCSPRAEDRRSKDLYWLLELSYGRLCFTAWLQEWSSIVLCVLRAYHTHSLTSFVNEDWTSNLDLLQTLKSTEIPCCCYKFISDVKPVCALVWCSWNWEQLFVEWALSFSLV